MSLTPSIPLPQLRLATPHIAGYSQEGKIRGALMVYRAVCAHFDWPLPTDLNHWMPPVQEWPLPGALPQASMATLCSLLSSAYDIGADDEHFRQALKDEKGQDNVACSFDGLRKRYIKRREFGFLQMKGQPIDGHCQSLLRGAGFRC